MPENPTVESLGAVSNHFTEMYAQSLANMGGGIRNQANQEEMQFNAKVYLEGLVHKRTLFEKGAGILAVYETAMAEYKRQNDAGLKEFDLRAFSDAFTKAAVEYKAILSDPVKAAAYDARVQEVAKQYSEGMSKEQKEGFMQRTAAWKTGPWKEENFLPPTVEAQRLAAVEEKKEPEGYAIDPETDRKEAARLSKAMDDAKFKAVAHLLPVKPKHIEEIEFERKISMTPLLEELNKYQKFMEYFATRKPDVEVDGKDWVNAQEKMLEKIETLATDPKRKENLTDLQKQDVENIRTVMREAWEELERNKNEGRTGKPITPKSAVPQR